MGRARRTQVLISSAWVQSRSFDALPINLSIGSSTRKFIGWSHFIGFSRLNGHSIHGICINYPCFCWGCVLSGMLLYNSGNNSSSRDTAPSVAISICLATPGDGRRNPFANNDIAGCEHPTILANSDVFIFLNFKYSVIVMAKLLHNEIFMSNIYSMVTSYE